jgi:predicted Rossmann fold flavoprotein
VTQTYDSIVIGGGAAGLFCALTAGARERRVLVLERNREVGAKIAISGGGRCNFTNLHTAPDRFLSANPDFARSALARYTPTDFIHMVERHRIPYYEKTLGQLFCDGTGAARAIVRMLLDECAAGGVEIRTGCTVRSVSFADRFRIESDQGTFEAPTLVLASGGLSIPKIGATDFAYRTARQFGLPIVEPRPGLVPFTVDASDRAWMGALSGISTPVSVQTGGAMFREAALFTHRGLSGPAILQASSYWCDGAPITIDWIPDASEDVLVARKRARPKAQIKTVLAEMIPARLAAALSAAVPDRGLGDIKDQTLNEIARRLGSWRLTPSGTEGFAKAEVTVGGVDTTSLSQQTMEARHVPGLFIIGEAVDVTGWLGGYNFQWAWASGWAAGTAL